jgi:hypothetical protein
VLEGAFVDFVFVAMIDVVVQVKMLLFIWNVGIVFLDFFFFFHPSAPPDSGACAVSQKRKIPRRNVLTTKERQKPEKNNAIYIASSV